MSLYLRNRTLLAKRETTYGTDSAPAGATDGVLVRSLEIRPLQLETVDHTVVRPYFGSFQQLISGRMVQVTVELPAAGFGTAGPASPTAGYDALLRACGLSRTVNAGTSVVYTPVSSGFDSVTLKAYQDGTLHSVLGARGTVSLSMDYRGLPVWRFEFTGLYVAVADAALVQPTLTAYQTPLPFVFGNCTLANFLGSATGVCLRSLNIALGNTVVYSNVVNCTETVDITGRDVTGSFTMEATTVAAKDIWAQVSGASLSAIGFTHGTTAGNRVGASSSVVQVLNPSFSEQEGIVLLSGDLRFVPSAANNEITFTIS